MFTHSKAHKVGHTTQVSQQEAGMASQNNPKVAFFKWKYSHYFSLPRNYWNELNREMLIMPWTKVPLHVVIQTPFNIACFHAFHASLHEHEHAPVF